MVQSVDILSLLKAELLTMFAHINWLFGDLVLTLYMWVPAKACTNIKGNTYP